VKKAAGARHREFHLDKAPRRQSGEPDREATKKQKTKKKARRAPAGTKAAREKKRISKPKRTRSRRHQWLRRILRGMSQWGRRARCDGRHLRGCALLAPDRNRLAIVSCATPVEIVEAHGVRLGCTNELPEGCRARAGDQVDLRSGCTVHFGPMLVSMRGMAGLPASTNDATVEDLMSLDGIGNELAARVAQQRPKIRKFATWDQIAGIDGIGASKRSAPKQHFVIEAQIAPR
jgi:hypothetical protein